MGSRRDREEYSNLQELCVHSFLHGERSVAEKDCPSSAAMAIAKLEARMRQWTELGDDVGVRHKIIYSIGARGGSQCEALRSESMRLII